MSSCPLGYGNASQSPTEVIIDASEKPEAERPSSSGLSKDRTTSTIPGVDGDMFKYPSEEQFYKTVKRKGHDVDAGDMRMVVAIHNAVNERAWYQIKEVEGRLHGHKCAPEELRLVKFVGRPGEMSPKARFMRLFGGWTEPFDRHDWFVDRCGATVRYVVDFYDGKPTEGTAHLPLSQQPVSIFVDARPAVSSPSAVWDRVRMWAGLA
ncbi:hypothetical protein FOL47_004716 [Perkinsus chesapeaki]|uniref:Holocytochrome c-type synthase n=1 Tax=Perkinsus chesapeaki TaxID=330153 RepID=A0A7J6M0X3_PERCH|nr:hypothetical protein FOL47_004716 [Perkinsus chesapeaki]